MKPYISINDISLLSLALQTLSLLLELSPKLAYPEVERQYLSDICNTAHSSAISGAALDSLLVFFTALVKADEQIATHVIPNLIIPVQKEKKTDASLLNIAKSIGVIIKCHPSLAAGTIAKFSGTLKVLIGLFRGTIVYSMVLVSRTKNKRTIK